MCSNPYGEFCILYTASMLHDGPTKPMEREPLFIALIRVSMVSECTYMEPCERRISSLVCAIIGTGFQGSSSLFTVTTALSISPSSRPYSSIDVTTPPFCPLTSGNTVLAVKTSRTFPMRLDSVVMVRGHWLYHTPQTVQGPIRAGFPPTTFNTSQLATQAPHSVQMPGSMISRLSLPNDMRSLSFNDRLTLITLLSSSLNFFLQFSVQK